MHARVSSERAVSARSACGAEQCSEQARERRDTDTVFGRTLRALPMVQVLFLPESRVTVAKPCCPAIEGSTNVEALSPASVPAAHGNGSGIPKALGGVCGVVCGEVCVCEW